MMRMRPCSLMDCCQVAMKNLRLSVKALGIGPRHCDLRILEMITFSYIPCQALPHVKVYEKQCHSSSSVKGDSQLAGSFSKVMPKC